MTSLYGKSEFAQALEKDITKRERDYIAYMCEEWGFIIQQRIDVMRSLEQVYVDSFIGGMENDVVSRSLCSDLIVPDKETNKNVYMIKVNSSEKSRQ